MPDEKSGDSSAGNLTQNPALVEQPIESGSKSIANNGVNKTKEPAKEVYRIHVATFWVQVVLAVIGIGALWIYYHQLQQMIKATHATTKSANAAQCAANTASKQLKLTSQQLELDQRPWVAIYVQGPNPQPGSNTTVIQESMVTKNTGRTPAVHVHFACLEQTLLNFDSPPPDCYALEKNAWEDQFRKMYPGISKKDLRNKVDKKFTETMEAKTDEEWVIPPDSTGSLNEGVIAGFIRGSKANALSYMVGVLTYQDVLDKTKIHTTKFCFVKRSDAPIQLCQHEQWMN